MRRNAGVSLLELIVVVGILGTLAALVTFQYRGFQSKVRQIEAKLALSAIYQGEKLGFLEHGGYSRCLAQLGYEPKLAAPGVAQGYYARGFYASTGAGEVLDCDGLEVRGWGASKSVRAPAPAGVEALTGDSCCDGGFLAEAAGSISSSTTAFDRWTINDAQVLNNTDPQL